MERTMSHHVAVGVFYSQNEAQRAVSELKTAGFTDEQIGVVAHDPKKKHQPRVDDASGDSHKESKAAEGAATGVMAGAGVGALWALGIAAGMLPAIGPVVAGGILGSILLSAAGGAAVAGIAGALIGLGIPEEEAHYYEQEFKSGRTIVTVRANGRYDEAVAIMQRHNGFDMKAGSRRMHTPSTSTASTHTERLPTGNTQTQNAATATAMPRATSASCSNEQREHGDSVRLHDEELNVSKHPVEKGEVLVTKEIVTEHKTIDVPVTREEVVIERRPAGASTAGEVIGENQEIRIPVRDEEVDVQKRTVAREDVTVAKRKVKQTQRVSEDLRHERLKVDRSGEVNVKHTSN